MGADLTSISYVPGRPTKSAELIRMSNRDRRHGLLLIRIDPMINNILETWMIERAPLHSSSEVRATRARKKSLGGRIRREIIMLRIFANDVM